MLTVQRLRRAELWEDLACNGGKRTSVLRKLLSCQASAQLAGDSMLTLTIPTEDASGITEKQVLRIDESDASFDEWRILTVSSDSATGITTVTAEPVENLLADPALLTQVDGLGVTRHDIDIVSLTPTEILEQFVLLACPAWASLGTVDATDPVDVTFAWATPLAAIRQLAELTKLEFQLRRNGTAGYLIDLVTAIGSAAAVADLRAGKNLPGLTFGTSAQQRFTRLYPKGAEVDGESATLARAAWSVTNVAGLTLTLADPAGGDGPIGFDTQLVGLQLRKADGTLTSVTATDYDTQTVSVASAANVAAGDLVEFRDADGHELTFLESPTDVAAVGVRSGTLELSDLAATVNRAQNPALRSWPQGNALPDGGYAKVGGATITRETVETQLGGQSAKIVGANDGDGFLSPLIPIEVTDDEPYVSGYWSLWVETGQVRVELLAYDGAGALLATYPSGSALATSSQRNAWENLGLDGIDLNAIGAKSVRFRVVQHGAAAATCYADALQVTESAGQLDFIEGSGPVRLWQAANEQLRTSAGPALSLAASLVELGALDPVRWGQDSTVALGGTVRVTEPRVTTPFTTRVIALTRDYLVKGRTTVTLSTKPLDLTGALARPARAKRSAPLLRNRPLAPTLVVTHTETQLIGQPLLHIAVQPPASPTYAFSRITITSSIAGTVVTRVLETVRGPIEIPASWQATYTIQAVSVDTGENPGLPGEQVVYQLADGAAIAQSIPLLDGNGVQVGYPGRAITPDGLQLHDDTTDANGQYVSGASRPTAITHLGTSPGGVGANNFSYREFSAESYTIVAGDTLEYDVYIDPASPAAMYALDLHASDGSTLRAAGLNDQNGLGSHPSTDLSAKALGRWYHRVFDLASVWAGKTIDSWQSGIEGDAAGTYLGRLANVRITNAGALAFAPLSSGVLGAAPAGVGSGDNYSNVSVWIGDDAARRAGTALDGSGNLQAGVTQSSSGQQRVLSRGYIEGRNANGEHVTFAQPFQAVPAVDIFPILFLEPRAKFNANGDGTGTTAPDPSLPQYVEREAKNLTAEGFDLSVRLRQDSGTPTAHHAVFGAPTTITTEGATTDAPLTDGPASDDSYTVEFHPVLYATSGINGGDGFGTVSLTVEIDTVQGGVFTARATRTFSFTTSTDFRGVEQSKDFGFQFVVINAAGLANGDSLRVRILSLSSNNGLGHVEVTGVDVSYFIATSLYASGTPGAGDACKWTAKEVANL